MLTAHTGDSLQFLDKLNPQQREAVETVNGPVLILAGAGSGKTRVITYRIAYLIEHEGVAPDSILAVTFTNKAAAEMTERVSKTLSHRTLAKPHISTFHSFCVRMLRRDIEALQINGKGFNKSFVIYDEADQQQVVKGALRRLGVDDKKMTPRTILSYISSAKNKMQNPQEVYLASGDPKMEKVAQIYEIYRKELIKANALDFDDLLLESVRLLKGAGEVREKYQRRYHYLLVDEYQDTNRPQYEIMRELAAQRHNICCVGDEDQSIYSWRGADINNILDFEKEFPEAKIIRLEQNYRSTQPILEAAGAVVSNNLQRKGKNLWTAREGGAKIGFYEAPDGENESLFVADYIAKFAQRGTGEGDSSRAAILYRTNSQSRLFEESLRRYGLKYNVVGGFSFYERAEIKDMISYLKVILNPNDSVSLNRVINNPPRGIGKSTMETVERLALETGTSVWQSIGETISQKLLPGRALAALQTFREIIDDARAMMAGTFGKRMEETAKPDPAPVAVEETAELSDQHGFDFGAADDSFEVSEFDESESTSFDTAELTAPEAAAEPNPDAASTADLLKFLLDRTGYMKVLEQEDTPESQGRMDNLRELVNAAMDSRDRGESVGEFLDHAALVSDADQYEEGQQITLMSLHAAKGLEFPLVFLVGLEEGLFPHSRTLLSPNEIEEERRLCYVGMTRAMDQLIISRARYRRRYGTESPEPTTPSRFLPEIPEHLIEDIGSPLQRRSRSAYDDFGGERHYDYENEDQSATYSSGSSYGSKSRTSGSSYSGTKYNSIDNISDFFSSRGKKFNMPKMSVPEPSGKAGFRKGDRVKHPKYGEGVIYTREGEGDSAKITVQFNRFGLKKLVEKYAQLEKA